MSQFYQQKNLYLGNSHMVRQELRYLVPGTRTWAPWEGMPVTCWIAATPTGAPITNLGPFTTTPGVDGEYLYQFSTALVDANLTAYLDELVYQVVQGGPNNEYRSVTPLLVQRPRYVG